jgi:DNA-binding LacI/PurR family transcriptional regulator
MQGLSEALGRAGLDLLVLPAAQAERRGETIAQLLRRKVVRGAVVRTTADSRGRVHAMARDEVPFVVVAERFDDPAIACVTAPADPACRRAIEHLIHLGHTRIAITLNLIDDHDHAARLAVWRSVLDQHGLEASERLVLRVPAFQDAGAMALRQLMAMPERPTAVFCTDPLAAVGMCHEAQRSGVAVPDQLSVLGFDDTDQRMLTYPSLSAVCQDAKGLGVAACQALQRLLDHPGTADLGDGPACWFEPRDSTGPAPTPRT